MHVQLGAEPGIHIQLYGNTALVSMELSSSQAPPLLIHWLEIQSFNYPILCVLPVTTSAVLWYLKFCFLFPNLLTIILLCCVLQELLHTFFLEMLAAISGDTEWGVLNPSL